MQVIYQNKDEERSSREANLVSTIICARKISRYMEEKYLGRFRNRTIRI